MSDSERFETLEEKPKDSENKPVSRETVEQKIAKNRFFFNFWNAIFGKRTKIG